jgi:hypothetical protein
MRRAAFGLLLLGVMAGCRCQGGPVDPVELGIRVEPREVDFGRVLEGAVGRRTVTLAAETRAPVTVTLATSAPFGAPREAEVPGGGDTSFEVTFRAGDGPAQGVLRLTVGDKTAEVPLRGVGVRPPPCIPSKECVLSEYSLALDTCVETPAPDDAPCDPKSLCLEQGRCRAGQCLGVARRCDDNDACTDDACSMELGCVHTPRVCPQPARACHVATCSPATGCGEAPAADNTPCGPVDCVAINVCQSGECTAIDTPEGFPCAPPVACLPEATCQNKVCERPLISEWQPDWSASLAAEPVGGLMSAGSQLFFSICGAEPAPAADAGAEDAGADGGHDGGVDAGEADAGLEPWCALASYTATGFERFTRRYEDGARRDAWFVDWPGLVLRVDGGVEVRSRMNGELRDFIDVEAPRERLVLGDDALLLVSPAGEVLAWRDGGAVMLADAGVGAALAGGEVLFAWAADAGRLTRVEALPDGGVETASFTLVGPAGLVTDGRGVLLGAEAWLEPSLDGGFEAVALDWRDAGVVSWLPDEQLVAGDTIDVFFWRCDGGPGCAPVDRETRVRAFDVRTGEAQWEALVLPAGVEGRVLATTMLDEQPGAVATLVRADFDAGAQTVLQVFSGGQRRLLCRLPEASGAVTAAHFATSSLVVTAQRADGGFALEAYPLNALPVSTRGWPRPHGLDGARRAR